MSKIAEQKALEAYPMVVSEQTISCRLSYSEGYDKAIQDFLEKACEWLKEYTDDYIVRDTDDRWLREDDFIEQFKNYMQDESEN